VRLAGRVLAVLGGFAALLAGAALLVLPGPGIPLLLVGLGLLSVEFEWARRLLAVVRRHAERVTPASRGRRIALGALTGAAALAGAVAAAVFDFPGL
jgi:hypothetical protein